MSWQALWRAPAIDPVTLNLQQLFRVTQNPQGTLAADVGSLAIGVPGGSVPGALYRKEAGGSSAFGWYLLRQPQDLIEFGLHPRGSPSLSTTASLVGPSSSGAPNIIVTGAPVSSAAGVLQDEQGQWIGGYSTAALNNVVLWAPTTVAGLSHAVVADPGGLTRQMTWDFVTHLMTTPAINNGATVTTIADLRIWAGVTVTSALQTAGGVVSSDVLATAFPTALTVGVGPANPQYGAMFRFSPALANWQVVTTNNNGAAYSQTVTDMGVPVAADTVYKLRLRMTRDGAGAMFLRASIDDGAEVSIAANVSAGLTGGANTRVICPVIPYVGFQNLSGAAVRKSLSIGAVRLWCGHGTEL